MPEPASVLATRPGTARRRTRGRFGVRREARQIWRANDTTATATKLRRRA